MEINKIGADELTVSRNDSVEVKKISSPSPGGHLQNLSIWNSEFVYQKFIKSLIK